MSWQGALTPGYISLSCGFYVKLSSLFWDKKWKWWLFWPKKQMLHDGSGWFISSSKMKFLGFLRQHSNDQFYTIVHLYNSTEECSCKCEAIAYFRNMYLKFQPVKQDWCRAKRQPSVATLGANHFRKCCHNSFMETARLFPKQVITGMDF